VVCERVCERGGVRGCVRGCKRVWFRLPRLFRPSLYRPLYQVSFLYYFLFPCQASHLLDHILPPSTHTPLTLSYTPSYTLAYTLS
jgi:hypothetical protein